MRIENEIYDILVGKTILTNVDKANELTAKFAEIVCEIYEKSTEENKDDLLKDCGAYLFSKAIESQVLRVIRPNVRIWFLNDEIQDGAVFNLPNHIEEKMYDYMDAADKAIDMYLKGKKKLTLKQLMVRIQNIGYYIANRDKLAENTVLDLNNKEVMIRDEMYNFVIGACKNHLEKNDFIISKVMYGYANPINIIATKNDVTYHIAVNVSIAPNTPDLTGWRLKAAKSTIKDQNVKLGKLNVMINSKEEKYDGVAVAKGEYEVKMQPLQVLNQPIIEEK